MDTNTNADTQTPLVKRKRKREKRELTSAKTEVCNGQLTPTGLSQAQMLELKRTTTLSKQSPLYKPKGTLEQIIYFLKMT